MCVSLQGLLHTRTRSRTFMANLGFADVSSHMECLNFGVQLFMLSCNCCSYDCSFVLARRDNILYTLWEFVEDPSRTGRPCMCKCLMEWRVWCFLALPHAQTEQGLAIACSQFKCLVHDILHRASCAPHLRLTWERSCLLIIVTSDCLQI